MIQKNQINTSKIRKWLGGPLLLVTLVSTMGAGVPGCEKKIPESVAAEEPKPAEKKPDKKKTANACTAPTLAASNDSAENYAFGIYGTVDWQFAQSFKVNSAMVLHSAEFELLRYGAADGMEVTLQVRENTTCQNWGATFDCPSDKVLGASTVIGGNDLPDSWPVTKTVFAMADVVLLSPNTSYWLVIDMPMKAIPAETGIQIDATGADASDRYPDGKTALKIDDMWYQFDLETDYEFNINGCI